MASALFVIGALWLAGLAVRHYRASVEIVDDPSIRELEQTTALVYLGIAAIVLAHAVVAAYFTRHPIRLHGTVIGAVGTVAGVFVAGSFLQLPVLAAQGVLPVSLVVCCGIVGYIASSPWASVYLGALTGSLAGYVLTVPDIEPLVVLAVVAPQVLVAFAGTALGRLVRRVGPLRRRD